MKKALTIGWMLLAAQAVALSMLFGAYYGLKVKLGELTDHLRELDQRVGVAERRMAVREQPSTPVAAFSASAPVEPLGDASAPGDASVRVDEPHNQPTPKTSPDAVVCVDKLTHTIFACENAANCLGPKSFDATYFNNMRTRLGITNSMMICGMKSTERSALPESDSRD